MPKSTQIKLIRQTKALGNRGNSTGMCYGIDGVIARAILLDNLEDIDQLVSFLLNFETAKIAAAVASAKQKVKESKVLSLTDRKLLDALAFFEMTELFHHPRRYMHFLGENISSSQSFLDVLPTVYPEKLKNKHVDILAQFTNIHDQQSMQAFLHELEKISTLYNYPIPIIVSANNHAITISYKPTIGWIFADPNQLPSKRIQDTDEMAQKVMTAFNLKNTTHQQLAMNVELYAAEPANKRVTEKINRLQKNLHKSITSDTVKITLPDVSTTYESLLNLATSSGNEDVVKRLLKKGAVTTRQVTDLAIMHNQLNTFELLNQSLLLSADDKIHYLTVAMSANSKKIVESILEQDAALADASIPEPRNPSPLFMAIDRKHTRLVKLLLNYPINLEKKDHMGNTALLRAAHKGNYTVVKMLINVQADLHVTNKEKDGLLTLAAMGKNKKIVSLVIKKLKPANLNPKDSSGNNLIHELLTKEALDTEKYWKIANYLLGKGATLSKDEARQLRNDYSLTLKQTKATKLGYTHLAALLTPQPSDKPDTFFKHASKHKKDPTKVTTPTPKS